MYMFSFIVLAFALKTYKLCVARFRRSGILIMAKKLLSKDVIDDVIFSVVEVILKFSKLEVAIPISSKVEVTIHIPSKVLAAAWLAGWLPGWPACWLAGLAGQQNQKSKNKALFLFILI